MEVHGTQEPQSQYSSAEQCEADVQGAGWWVGGRQMGAGGLDPVAAMRGAREEKRAGRESVWHWPVRALGRMGPRFWASYSCRVGRGTGSFAMLLLRSWAGGWMVVRAVQELHLPAEQRRCGWQGVLEVHMSPILPGCVESFVQTLFLHTRCGRQPSWASQRWPSQPKVQSDCSSMKGFRGIEVMFESPRRSMANSCVFEFVSIERSFWAVFSSSVRGLIENGAGR